jgi:hypothetical protein
LTLTGLVALSTGDATSASAADVRASLPSIGAAPDVEGKRGRSPLRPALCRVDLGGWRRTPG